jgi:hypothetical protein
MATPSIVTGVLVKKGAFVSNWKRRWFVFDTASRRLTYSDKAAVIGTIPALKGDGTVGRVDELPDRPGKRQHRFNIVMEFHVQRGQSCDVEVAAESAIEKERWLHALSQATATMPVNLGAGHAMHIAPVLQRVFCGVGWHGKGGQEVDVDASAICFSGGNPGEAVWWRNLQHPGGPMNDMVRTDSTCAPNSIMSTPDSLALRSTPATSSPANRVAR